MSSWQQAGRTEIWDIKIAHYSVINFITQKILFLSSPTSPTSSYVPCLVNNSIHTHNLEKFTFKKAFKPNFYQIDLQIFSPLID